ncbi:MAG: Rpn family recombination-promoting nuclease/putative transposase [Spirochaetia bacterium]|nr:Rpn family recombination-promoting nuclease/putative transposase [Spirochaetia bacterium]
MEKDLLNPCYDVIFKSIFTQASTSSKMALHGLASAIIGQVPQEITVVNSEIPITSILEKNVRLDLNCKMDNGDLINIEMQTCRTKDDLTLRTMYYGCKLMASSEVKGLSYSDLPKVYQVMFTDFVMFNNQKDFLQKFTLCNESLELTDHLQIIFIQMPLIETKEIKNWTDLEKWGIFLRDAAKKDKRRLIKNLADSDQGIGKAMEVLMTVSEDEKRRAIQLSYEKYETDRASELYCARREGIEQNRLEMARKMKARGFSITDITDLTGLTLEQLQAL